MAMIGAAVIVVTVSVTVPMVVSMVVPVIAAVVRGVEHHGHIFNSRAEVAVFFTIRESDHLIKC